MQNQPSARRTASGNIRRVKRKRGDQWYIQYRLPDGRQGQKRLGPAWSGNGRPPAGYFTKRTAQTALRQFLTDADRGVLPEAQQTGATVGDAVEEWLRYVEHERGVRATTLREYRTSTRKHLVPAFGDRKLEAVTTRSIEAWKSQLLADGKLSRRTINKLLTNLHGVFDRARRVWGLEKNPVADVERLRERYDAGDYDWLRPEEVYALVRAAEEAPIEKRVAEQDAAIFLTAAFAGLRLGEVLGLRWRDVDFAGSVLRVSQQWNDLGEVSVTKGGRVRAVPMVARGRGGR
jgi:integrase